jgi:aspartokinase-like uncharacterized kinase
VIEPAIVVKLGGSLAYEKSLTSWTRELAAHGAGRIVVVPGGGPFADQVRAAQVHWRFSDSIAHRMALAAMDQYGTMLSGLEPRFAACKTYAEIRAALTAGRVPIWLPSRMLENAADIQESWDVTSDSLAAWLAKQMGARALILVKSCALGADRGDMDALTASGIVDPAFRVTVRDKQLRVIALEKPEWIRLSELLNELGG